ncbi:protein cramped [Plutella xylostella]|uniref:protein cramped n=1 Tax=Plutella xylostella TaxID=51655 RepID=UPI002032483C|nr:protein cramped [Plutella xylostella]
MKVTTAAEKFSEKVVTVKEPSSPSPPPPERPQPGPAQPELLGSLTAQPELLGSLTTQQQQRTSARVIKKLRLDDAPSAKKDATQECDTSQKPKEDEKEPLKLTTVKPRMPKAIWLTDEKSLFFEALNEYGKDFDAITAHICAKMKKKGVPDVMLKTKSQVSHFYYRTWHKLSKHVHFDENVKKVAQELYALINYGELRKKLVSVPEKTCARLGEMVARGGLVLRARGRQLRVRTPPCRALRKLNQIHERCVGNRVCSRCVITLRARTAAAWARVAAAAHNPRAQAELPLRTRLDTFINALQKRWSGGSEKHSKLNPLDKDEEDSQEATVSTADGDRIDADDHLHMEPERLIVEESKLPKKLSLHVGPPPGAVIHLPVLTGSEHLSSQKICFASYLERMCSKDKQSKIRTPKRQRKDSATDKDKEVEQKKFKADETTPTPKQRMDIDETAIDGIELMATIKHNHEDEEQIGKLTEDEKETKHDELTEEERDGATERDKELSEKEKDSFSEMEDDEKFNNDTDNESDGRVEKNGKERKFKNLKVKFRIRPKKRGGSVCTLVGGAGDAGGAGDDAAEVQIKVPEDKEETQAHEDKPDIDAELVTRQVRRGWSATDAGNLTVGDLYLMFGSRSKIQLDYWWAEATPPLPQPITITQKQKTTSEGDKTSPVERVSEKEKNGIDKKEKADKTPEKGTDSSVEDDKEKRESDTDIFSPKNTYSQDSNDGLSGDERKNEQLLSPDHKSLRLSSKLVNRPEPPAAPDYAAVMTERLKRLLSLAGNPHVPAPPAPPAAPAPGKCPCGHVCAQKKKPHELEYSKSISLMAPPPPPAPGKCPCGHVCAQKKKPHEKSSPQPLSAEETHGLLFRHPTPLAPQHTDNRVSAGESRGSLPQRHLVVQRMLPLLPSRGKHVEPVEEKAEPPSQSGSVDASRDNAHNGATSTEGELWTKGEVEDYSLSSLLGQLGNDNQKAQSQKSEETNANLFRYPTPIAPKQQDTAKAPKELITSDLPPYRRGRARAEPRVVVQRLLPLMPKYTQSNNLIPVKLVSNTPPPPPKIAPRPSPPQDIHFYVLNDMKGQLFNAGSPAAAATDNIKFEVGDIADLVEEPPQDAAAAPPAPPAPAETSVGDDDKQQGKSNDFLPVECLSLSPSRLLRDSAWLEGGVQDFSLSSFLGHLEARPPDLQVDSHLQSLMVESSVDYVAKFADLAAEVTKEPDLPPSSDIP